MYEMLMGVFGMLISIISWYVKRQESRIDNLEKSLAEHRLEDVATYVPRTELQDFADKVRQDMKDIMQPVSMKLQSIEEYLRKDRH